MLPFRRKGAPATGTMSPVSCQLRSKTESPCLCPTEVEILGVAFCGASAPEQEAYFAIGEVVAWEKKHGVRSEQLAEVLKRTRRERVVGKEGIAADAHRGTSGTRETGPLALSNG